MTLIISLAACRTQAVRQRRFADGAPDVHIDLSKIPEPVPKAEALSRYGNKPYSVFGKPYDILPTRAGYFERGTASWYGTKFHGKLTSTREPYDMFSYTAAHKTLPIPAYAQVTNVRTGQSIIVRINDRGPFVDDRIIDLSYVAAVKLGIHLTGTGEVEVRTITPGETAPSIVQKPAVMPAPQPAPAPAQSSPVASNFAPKAIYLQSGAFGDPTRAQAHLAQLLNQGFSEARVVRGQDGLHRVLIGPFANRDAAQLLANLIADSGFAPPSIYLTK